MAVPLPGHRKARHGVRVLEGACGRDRSHRERPVVARDGDAGDRHRVADLEPVSRGGRDRDRGAVLLGAAARGRARRRVDGHVERGDRGYLRVAGAEGHDLRLVSAAEVTQRDGLHLVDRLLVRGDVCIDLLLAPLGEVAVAVRLLVVGQADARVGHDRLAAAGLDGGRSVAVAARAVELVAVERVVPAELVAHLVRDVVDRVQVADGSRGCPCSRLPCSSRRRRRGWRPRRRAGRARDGRRRSCSRR